MLATTSSSSSSSSSQSIIKFTQSRLLSFVNSESTFEELIPLFCEKKLIYKDFPNLNLYLLKYDKRKADLENADVRRCRGLVFDRTSHKIVGACPEKSDLIGDTDTRQLTYEEFYDGTNINVFFHNDNWHISTRSSIGAGTSFISEKTFREMFFEALDFDLNKLEKSFCYSFVLLHPENRIVCPVHNAQIILVEAHKIVDDEIHLLDLELTQKYLREEREVNVIIPTRHMFDSFQDARKYTESLGFESQGLILKNVSNNVRAKIRGQEYCHARLIKGNTNNMLERYLNLRKEKQLKLYLKYFPEFTEQFKTFNRTINDTVNKLHFAYIQCFIKKEVTHSDSKFVFKPLLFALHKMHMEQKIIITREVVYEFFLEQSAQKQLFVLQNLER